MKCAQCSYVLDFFDTICPNCKIVVSAHPPITQTVSAPQQATASKAAIHSALPHSQAELKRYLAKNWLQGVLFGIAIGFLLALPIGLALNVYRLSALAVRFKSHQSGLFYQFRMTIGDVPLLLSTAIIVLVLASAVGWWIGHYWEETASAHPQTKGTLTTQTKIFGVCGGFGVAFIFILWQHLHATIMTTAPLWLRRSEYYWSFEPPAVPNELFVIKALAVTLMIIGAAIGFFLGKMIGRQQYEQARHRNFRPLPVSGQALTGKSSTGITINWGIWLVGAISLIMPCVGVLLYIVYSKDEDERAIAAAIGVAIALVLIGLRTFLRLSVQL